MKVLPAASPHPELNSLLTMTPKSHASLGKEPTQFDKFQSLSCLVTQPIPVYLVWILISHRVPKWELHSWPLTFITLSPLSSQNTSQGSTCICVSQIAILIAQINARLLKFPVNSILVDIAKGSYNSHKLLTAYRNSQPHFRTRGDLLSFSLKAFWICLRGLSPTPQKPKLGSPLWAPFLPSHLCSSTIRPEPRPQQLPSWGAATMALWLTGCKEGKVSGGWGFAW